MAEFVTGQKVVCIAAGEDWEIKKDRIYEVESFDGSWVKCKGVYQAYYPRRFKTIIQSLDDVVLGMELTSKFGRGVVTGKYGNCAMQTVPDAQSNHINYLIHYKIFEEYVSEENEKEKEMIEDYEVVKPFTVLDIWDAFKDNHNCSTFQKEFGKLLEECTKEFKNIGCPFEDITTFERFSSIVDNLHHLEEKGFLRKKKEMVILRKGMILRNSFGASWKVISDQDGKIGLLGMTSLNLYNYMDTPLFMTGGITLRNFNEFYVDPGDEMEVVSE